MVSKMGNKKTAQIRKCVGTNERHEKSELLRVVRKKSMVMIDPSGQIKGRGAYIKPDATIIKKAQKKNALSRALRMRVDPEIYDALLELLSVDGTKVKANE